MNVYGDKARCLLTYSATKSGTLQFFGETGMVHSLIIKGKCMRTALLAWLMMSLLLLPFTGGAAAAGRAQPIVATVVALAMVVT